jgi:hypothetical protein
MKIKKVWKGVKIRVISMLRCLFYKQFILVAWSRCKDGDLDFHITHKGVNLPDAVHRLKVDAVEILQDKCDEEDAVFEAIGLVKGEL